MRPVPGCGRAGPPDVPAVPSGIGRPRPGIAKLTGVSRTALSTRIWSVPVDSGAMQHECVVRGILNAVFTILLAALAAPAVAQERDIPP